jgi:DNA-binding response OmpR family regulator
VLVVDDSLEALNGLCNLLKADCNALFGMNGLEALALATSESPDLIVLDVAMPGMDGYEVLRRLKEEPATRNIPVIFLTARHDLDDRVRGLDAGADDYLAKPFSMVELLARLRALLRRGGGDEALRREFAALWRERDDRYSEIRTAATTLPGAKKIEMSYIGG